MAYTVTMKLSEKESSLIREWHFFMFQRISSNEKKNNFFNSYNI